MAGRLTAALLALAAAAFLISLFLPWAEQDAAAVTVWNATGWETIAAYGTLPAVGVLLWEALRAAAVPIGVRSPALPSFFLGAAASFFGIASFVHLRWGGPIYSSVRELGDFRYGAWLGLWSSVLILAGALARLAEHGRVSAPRAAGGDPSQAASKPPVRT